MTSTVVTYAAVMLMERIRSRKADTKGKKQEKLVFVCSLAVNLGMLFYFKYTNFALSLFSGLSKLFSVQWKIPEFDILLPVGISFYIFQSLGYMVDVYRGEEEPEKNFFRYALFVSFFPQLVAGPIERSKNLLRQLAEPKRFDYVRVREGLLLMLWGFFLKMVIADRCAVLVNTVYENDMAYHGYQVIVANVLFAFQIYCDFMGYSQIARGSAQVLGCNLMENFRQPYLSRSIKEFWRRWHISLSSWFRDYLYIPLGGSRCGKAVRYRNLMITFLASGLWHGAGLSFIAWGGVHGLYQIVEEAVSPFFARFYERHCIDTEKFSWNILRTIRTFVLADIAWVFFRADSCRQALRILKNSLELSNTGMLLNDGLYQLGLSHREMSILAAGLAVLAVYGLLRESGQNVMNWLSGQNIIFRYVAYWTAIVLITFSLNITGQEFIYFQF